MRQRFLFSHSVCYPCISFMNQRDTDPSIKHATLQLSTIANFAPFLPVSYPTSPCLFLPLVLFLPGCITESLVHFLDSHYPVLPPLAFLLKLPRHGPTIPLDSEGLTRGSAPPLPVV
jgi:hypothetical protein